MQTTQEGVRPAERQFNPECFEALLGAIVTGPDDFHDLLTAYQGSPQALRFKWNLIDQTLLLAAALGDELMFAVAYNCGAEPNIYGKSAYAVIHVLATTGGVANLEKLLANPATDVNLPLRTGRVDFTRFPFRRYGLRERTPIVPLTVLIQSGAPALAVALSYKNIAEAIALLSRADINVDVRLANETHIRDLVAELGSIRLFRAFYSRVSDANFWSLAPFFEIAFKNRRFRLALEAYRYFVRNDSGIDKLVVESVFLEAAAKYNRWKSIKPVVRECDLRSVQRAFNVAAAYGSLDVLRNLWELREQFPIDLNQETTVEGRSKGIPLTFALNGPDMSMFTFLLDAGADPDGCVDGQSVLYRATENGNEARVSALLVKNANPNTWGTGSEPRNPLRKAILGGNPRCVELLLSAGAEVRDDIEESTFLALELIERGNPSSHAIFTGFIHSARKV